MFGPGKRRLAPILIVISICLTALPVFFHEPRHYFQGDTLYWFGFRHLSLGAFFRDFAGLDLSGWYRPLTNRTIQSLLFPYVGLNPMPYRLIGMMLFSLNIASVYFFFRSLAGRTAVAVLGTIFFAFHSANAYTTYDVAFTPELTYGLFYTWSAFAFLHWLRSGSNTTFGLSIVFCCLGFFSKEASVTLPLTLFVLALTIRHPDLKQSFRAVRYHLGLLALYAVVVIGWFGLGRTALADPFGEPADVEGYQLVFTTKILTNLDSASSLAFNLPRGWYSNWRELSDWMLTFLKAFRVVAGLLLIGVLIKGPRNLLAFGILWFLTALTPTLPLFRNFLPHYLFVPLVGFSLAIGLAFDFFYRSLERVRVPLAAPILAVLFGVLAWVNTFSVWNDQAGHVILGGSSRAALLALDRVRQLRPGQQHLTIYFHNEKHSELAYQHGWGTMFESVWPGRKFNVLYSIDAANLSASDLKQDGALVLDYRGERVTDLTDIAMKEPALLLPLETSPLRLELSRHEVLAGLDSYAARISSLPDRSVRFLYAVNDIRAGTFDAQLDARGEVRFSVGAETAKGSYTFLAVLPEGRERWALVDAQLFVR